MKKQIKKSTRNILIALIIFMALTTLIRLCIITVGDWYDKGKYFTCQTHVQIFMHAPKDSKFKGIEIVKRRGDSDEVRINFEEFWIEAESNSYITSWMFGIPLGLNLDQVTINDGKMLLVLDKDVEFEFPYTEIIDKEQREKLVNNYKETIEWACDVEFRIIIVRFVVLGVLMYVVIKAGKKKESNPS